MGSDRENKWEFYWPKFEYEEVFQDLSFPWAGHKHFAYDLVRNFKPKSIVELGTYKGTSLFSFCQAVKDEKLGTEIYAVDTWEGDAHAGFYDESVFQEVINIRNTYYPDLKVNLVRKAFDDAVSDFDDNSIDLLHIDGFHTYEAVKHDFDKWLIKVKDGGIILFHDIVEKRADFGVYKLWDEIKEKYKTLEFIHSHGLGVLFKTYNVFEKVFNFQNIWQRYYAGLEELKIRDHEISQLKTNINVHEELIRDKDDNILTLEDVVRDKDTHISNLQDIVSDKDAHISNLQDIFKDKDAQISNLETQLNTIYNSRGFRALLIYYRIRNKLLPPNSNRLLFAKLLFWAVRDPRSFVRNLNKDNIKSFFKQCKVLEPSALEHKVRSKLLNTAAKLQVMDGPANSVSTQNELVNNLNLNELENINFKRFDQPAVSIIIPVHNNWRYTYNCLRSIYVNTDLSIPYEIIIADDKSTDETSEMLKKITGIEVINNQVNLGFLKNCNHAADYAKGKYILFLNNDTEVKENWLASLLKTAENDEKIGLVGAKLLYPDGRIQEAGGILGQDGWGCPYGHFDNPEKYEYNYVKEVDCIIGACLLIRKNVFFEVGKFNEIYAPAFYEEFDLEFAMREAGCKTIYQPQAVIIHYSSSSYGPEVRDEQSSRNHAKFIEKWPHRLAEQLEPHKDLFLARDRSKNKKIILFIDDRVPDYDKHAGSLLTYQYLRLFYEMGFKVIFIPDSLTPLEPYTSELQQMGIEVVYGPFDFNGWIKQNGRYIHYAWLTRPDVAIKYINAIKQYTQAKIMYFTCDLHYLRELRRYEIEKTKEVLDESRRYQKMEFSLFEKSDSILTPSDYEQTIIKKEFPKKPVAIIPLHYYETSFVAEEIPTDGDGRNGLIFLGGFRHIPNVDAVKWFVNDIYPTIKQKIPEVKLYVVGSNPPSDITALNGTDIIVTGYVKDLEPLFRKGRVFISPLRYGAGVKGKIITSLSYGVPVVTTSIGNEGINLKEGIEALIADDPVEFANKTVELYKNPGLWMELSKNSLSFIKHNFSKDKAKHTLMEALDIIIPNCKVPEPVSNKKSQARLDSGIICLQPFYVMCLFLNYNVYNCVCLDWIKHSIGNLKRNSIKEIWNSDIARWIRREMYKGEWEKICNPICPIIIQFQRENKFHQFKDLDQFELLTPKLIEEIRLRRDYLESPPTLFKLDNSNVCNLSCIMCSKEAFKEEPELVGKTKEIVSDYLPTAKKLILSGTGDPLARPDTRDLLLNYKGAIKFDLITNALLLPNYWEKIKHQNFGWLIISIDAAHKETYEKIRVGGKWENLLNSLALIKEYRNKFDYIEIDMTVMRSNYKEIPQFINFAESYGFNVSFHGVRGNYGKENIFAMKDLDALSELGRIVIHENSKKRNINVNWGDLLTYLNLWDL